MIAAATIITYIEAAMAAAKLAKDVSPYAKAIYDAISGKEVTQEDLDKLAAETDRLSAELQAPIPDGD